jgi:hypothetical protein
MYEMQMFRMECWERISRAMLIGALLRIGVDYKPVLADLERGGTFRLSFITVRKFKEEGESDG